jgi:hypothetical protein
LKLRSLPPEVQEVRITRREDARRHHWTDRGAGMVLEDARQLLQDAINEKASMLPRYLTQCDRCWLLLAADAFRPSTYIEPDQNSLSHVYESPFERTYFLNCFHGAPMLLHTRGPPVE